MNAGRERKAAGPPAKWGVRVRKAPLEQPKPSVAVSSYLAAEVEAEYGCVDWYQYPVRIDEQQTRH